MSSRRRVTVDRDGRFEIAGHRYTVQRSGHVLSAGLWEVWPDDPAGVTGPAPRAGTRPEHPIAVETTYKDIRDRIDRAAEDGGFR